MFYGFLFSKMHSIMSVFSIDLSLRFHNSLCPSCCVGIDLLLVVNLIRIWILWIRKTQNCNIKRVHNNNVVHNSTSFYFEGTSMHCFTFHNIQANLDFALIKEKNRMLYTNNMSPWYSPRPSPPEIRSWRVCTHRSEALGMLWASGELIPRFLTIVVFVCFSDGK